MRATLTICLILSAISIAHAQIPGTKWINYYHTSGSNQIEAFFDIKTTADSGYIFAGADSASTFDKGDFLNNDLNSHFAVPWLVKVDKNATVAWTFLSNMYPQPTQGAFNSVTVDPNGDIVAVGYGRIYSPPSTDLYISKLDGNGKLLWYKLFGGSSGVSKGFDIINTNDGGYMVAGSTTSSDGDISGNHNAGTSDVWLLKLDANGNAQWKKCFGGSGNDSAYAVIQTPDNGFVVAGSSASSDGDLTANNGLSDGWIFKINSSGNLLWQKNVGGASYDAFKSIVLNSDTSFTLTGYTLSSTITDHGNYGKKDLWVIKIKDATGDVQWSKNFGGSQDEQGYSIQRTIGNGYLVSGYTESSDGDITGNNGLADAWMLKLNSDAGLIWQKCIGTSKNEFGTSGIYLSESDFAIAGFADPVVQSNIYDWTDAFASRLGNANLIKGLLFNDANSNGIRDAGEGVFNEALVTTTKSGFQRSTVPQNGIFNLDVDLGSYSTSVVVNSPYYTIVLSSVTSTFSTYFNTDSISFAVQSTPGNKDLEINAIPLTPARPGFYDNYRIFYKNIGTDVIASGEVIFKHDSRFHFVSADPAITSSNGDTLKWSYSNLKPFDSASITVYMQLNVPPTVNIGDTVTSVALISPVAGDVTPTDDTAWIKQRVIGSYDPNDKTENNGGIIGPDYIAQGKYLNYTIRFQNTGTDTAFSVIVRDTLDSKLDWSSFEMVTASHSYTAAITDQNKIEWTFSNINLPDSNVNEPASHGYLSYRVKPKSTVATGDVINNLASIYFDYNLPVPTNDATTLVQDNFSVLPVTLLNFTGQLNDNAVQLNWEVSNGRNFDHFEIERSADGRNFSNIGNVSFNDIMGKYNFGDNVSVLQSKRVSYRLKLVDNDGKFNYSRIITFNLKQAENSILVYPNPAVSEFFISTTSQQKGMVSLKITDASGKVVFNQLMEVQKGNTLLSLSTLNLNNGTYFIELTQKGQIKTSRFTVLH